MFKDDKQAQAIKGFDIYFSVLKERRAKGLWSAQKRIKELEDEAEEKHRSQQIKLSEKDHYKEEPKT